MESVDLSATLRQSRQWICEIEQEAEVRLSDCYQCGKCSAGCPVAFAMDVPPNRVIRMLQAGLVEETMQSHTVWLCAHCQTCYTRCPRQVNLPRLMEAVRRRSKAKGLRTEREIDLFNDLFLQSVMHNGRVHEMGLILRFNIQSGHLLKDAMKAPKLLLDGKISPLAHKIKDGGAVRRIFDNVARERLVGGEAH